MEYARLIEIGVWWHYRQIYMGLTEEQEKAMDSLDQRFRDLTPDESTGLPAWVARGFASADGSHIPVEIPAELGG